MNEQVLITGGAGFIGSHLVEACLERGYRVRVLDNLSLGRKEWVNPEAELLEGDIQDPDLCRKAAQNCAGIFHLAAMSRSAASLNNVEICTSNNIIGTQNVLTAARGAGVRKVIYSGSSTYYGNQKPPHKESMQPQFLNFYGLSKYVGEEYCLLFDRMYGVPAVVLRYFNVYGPRLSGEGAYALVISIFLAQLKAGKPLTIHGRGEQTRDFVHVRDVAEANILAFQSSMHDCTFNVGTGAPISVKQLADQISPLQVFEDRRAGDSEATQADISLIEKHLGWKPKITLEEGMRDLLQTHASTTSA